MATIRELSRIEDRVYRYSSSLTGELEKLGNIASKILGFEVIADICGGEEIEFREVGKGGYVNDFTCLRMEDVITKLKSTEETKTSI